MRFSKLLIVGVFLMITVNCQTKKPKPVAFAGPEWAAKKTIYELNIRQFSTSGTFKAVELRLIALKDLGAGIIWFMPVQPIGEENRKGSLGSYYSIKDYQAINPEFGTMEDFKSLVNKIHEMGMYAIIDWVANHTAWDNHLIEEHPDWYTQDSSGQIIAPVPDWTDVADLNYDNPEVWDYMIESMKFWLTETDIDGFRCDVAEMVPLEFWQRARTELDSIKPVLMLAEGEKPELHQNAFDITYSWNLYRLMNLIAKDKANLSAIDSLLDKEKQRYPAGAGRLRFTTNHDENSWNGTVFERLGDGNKAFAVLAATVPGIPLLYSGQEAGMDKRLKFFNRDPIIWRANAYRRFYSRLFRLYQKNPALNSGSMQRITTDSDSDVYAFVRENGEDKIVVILNLSGSEQQVQLDTDHIAGMYRGYFTGRKTKLKDDHHFTLKPWDYKIFVNIK